MCLSTTPNGLKKWFNSTRNSREKTSILNRRMIQLGYMNDWNWFDFIRTQLTFLKPGPAEWRLFPFPTYDSSSFHGKWIESAHGSSAFPRTSFNSTSDSSIFGKHWFESTRDSCGNIFDLNKLINKLWVIPSLQAMQFQGQSGKCILGQVQGRVGRLGFDVRHWVRACVTESGSIQDRFGASPGQD